MLAFFSLICEIDLKFAPYVGPSGGPRARWVQLLLL